MTLLSAVLKPWCRQLSNGMKVFIDDIVVMGRPKRIINVFGKSNYHDGDVLLYTRMKEYVPESKYSETFDKFTRWHKKEKRIQQTTDINRELMYADIEKTPKITVRSRLNYDYPDAFNGKYTDTFYNDITSHNAEELSQPLNIFQLC